MTMRRFIEEMRERGLVDEIVEPVSTRFEAAQMAAKTDRILLFRDCGGKPAVMNLTAGEARPCGRRSGRGERPGETPRRCLVQRAAEPDGRLRCTRSSSSISYTLSFDP